MVNVAGLPRRLIPACAGKTGYVCLACVDKWAHPRVCGENALNTSAADIRMGSSPRVRGKRFAMWTWFAFLGLIPACAGKTVRGYPT